MGRKLCWDRATTASDGWQQLHTSLSTPARPWRLSPHPLATSMLTSMFGRFLLITTVFILVVSAPAAEVIVILTAEHRALPPPACLQSNQRHAHRVSSAQHAAGRVPSSG